LIKKIFNKKIIPTLRPYFFGQVRGERKQKIFYALPGRPFEFERSCLDWTSPSAKIGISPPSVSRSVARVLAAPALED
jgi:hypothetical protein